MSSEGNASLERFGAVPTATKPSKRAQMIYWAQWSVLHQNAFRYYDYGPKRSEMFHRPLTKLSVNSPVGADCSQWYASIAKGCGVRGLTDTDYTGTLLQKGTLVHIPTPGDCVIFGGGTGEHAAMITYNGNTIGFGHWPGAPNRVPLNQMAAYFSSHGHPGVRFLSFVK